MAAGGRKLYLGKALHDARKEARLSIRELARSARVDATYISKLENRRVPTPSLSVLSRICAALPESSGKRILQSMLVEVELIDMDSKVANLRDRKRELVSEFIDRVAREVVGVSQLLSEQVELKEHRSRLAEVLREALTILNATKERCRQR